MAGPNRSQGVPPEVKTFESKAAAVPWARHVETNLDRGTHVHRSDGNALLFRDILERYRQCVTPQKRGASEESIRIKALQQERIAGYGMANLTPAVVAKFQDDRLKRVSAATVVRDLAAISSVINMPVGNGR